MAVEGPTVARSITTNNSRPGALSEIEPAKRSTGSGDNLQKAGSRRAASLDQASGNAPSVATSSPHSRASIMMSMFPASGGSRLPSIAEVDETVGNVLFSKTQRSSDAPSAATTFMREADGASGGSSDTAPLLPSSIPRSDAPSAATTFMQPADGASVELPDTISVRTPLLSGGSAPVQRADGASIELPDTISVRTPLLLGGSEMQAAPAEGSEAAAAQPHRHDAYAEAVDQHVDQTASKIGAIMETLTSLSRAMESLVTRLDNTATASAVQSASGSGQAQGARAVSGAAMDGPRDTPSQPAQGNYALSAQHQVPAGNLSVHAGSTGAALNKLGQIVDSLLEESDLRPGQKTKLQTELKNVLSNGLMAAQSVSQTAASAASASAQPPQGYPGGEQAGRESRSEQQQPAERPAKKKGFFQGIKDFFLGANRSESSGDASSKSSKPNFHALLSRDFFSNRVVEGMDDMCNRQFGTNHKSATFEEAQRNYQNAVVDYLENNPEELKKRVAAQPELQQLTQAPNLFPQQQFQPLFSPEPQPQSSYPPQAQPQSQPQQEFQNPFDALSGRAPAFMV